MIRPIALSIMKGTSISAPFIRHLYGKYFDNYSITELNNNTECHITILGSIRMNNANTIYIKHVMNEYYGTQGTKMHIQN